MRGAQPLRAATDRCTRRIASPTRMEPAPAIRPGARRSARWKPDAESRGAQPAPAIRPGARRSVRWKPDAESRSAQPAPAIRPGARRSARWKPDAESRSAQPAPAIRPGARRSVRWKPDAESRGAQPAPARHASARRAAPRGRAVPLGGKQGGSRRLAQGAQLPQGAKCSPRIDLASGRASVAARPRGHRTAARRARCARAG